MNKKLILTLCALTSFICLQAQQPPEIAASTQRDFVFHSSLPTLGMLAAQKAVQPILAAKAAVAAASAQELPAAEDALENAMTKFDEKYANLPENKQKLSENERKIIDELLVFDTREKKIEHALQTNNTDLYKLALMNQKIDLKKFTELAKQTIDQYQEPTDNFDGITPFEYLLSHAENIPQEQLDTLLTKAIERKDIYNLLMYGGIITTTGGKKFPIKGGARNSSFDDHFKYFPLHRAIALGSLDSTEKGRLATDELTNKFILDAGQRNTWWQEIDQDKLAAVNALLNANPDIDINQTNNYDKPLAAEDGSPIISELLTPLHVAAEHGSPAIAELLLSQGAEVNAKNDLDYTPLHLAASWGNTNIAAILINAGADVNAKDIDDGETPLHLAALRGHTQMVKLLINAGAEVDAKNSLGYAPLHLAAMNGHTEAVKLLIDAGAYVDTQSNKYGETPLYKAAEKGHTETIRLLIDAGAYVNIPDTAGYTPLHLATMKEHAKAARLLIANGADINAKNKYGYTALEYATDPETRMVLEQAMHQNTQKSEK